MIEEVIYPVNPLAAGNDSEAAMKILAIAAVVWLAIAIVAFVVLLVVNARASDGEQRKRNLKFGGIVMLVAVPVVPMFCGATMMPSERTVFTRSSATSPRQRRAPFRVTPGSAAEA